MVSKKIKKCSDGELLNAIKTLKHFFEDPEAYSDDELEKQKWEKLKHVIEDLKFDYENIENVLMFPKVILKLQPILDSYKDKYVSDKKLAWDSELKQYENAIIEEKKRLDISLVQSENNIEEKRKELESIKLLIENEKKSIGLLNPILDKFAKNREDIIQQTAIVQSIIGRVGDNAIGKPVVCHTPFTKSEIKIDDAEFYKNVSCALKENDYPVSVKKVILMQAALEACRGLFVPDIIWSRAYCDAHPNYHHFAISIDPSIKNIKDLWDLYLEDIVANANINPEQRFFIHFDGVNNSIPEVWMKALQDLVFTKDIRVPVKGLPLWPDNVYFFFTPSKHKYAFELTEVALGYFPMIHTDEPDSKQSATVITDKRVKKLSEKIHEKTDREMDACEMEAKKLIYDYIPYFRSGAKAHE